MVLLHALPETPINGSDFFFAALRSGLLLIRFRLLVPLVDD